jgi:hypothetical protein
MFRCLLHHLQGDHRVNNCKFIKRGYIVHFAATLKEAYGFEQVTQWSP